jgi:hypothetical protein
MALNLEVEYDDNRNITKLVVNDYADKQNFLEVQESIKKQRQAEHERTIELIQLQKQLPPSSHTQNVAIPAGATISELLDDYISISKVTADVVKKYKRVIGDFVAFCNENEINFLHQVTRKFVYSYLKHMGSNGKEDKTCKNYFGV